MNPSEIYFVCVNWIHFTQDSVRWRLCVNTVTKVRHLLSS